MTKGPRFEVDRAKAVRELEEAIRWRRLSTSIEPFQLDTTAPPAERVRSLQAAIDRRAAACGCREGKLGLAFSAVLVGTVLASDAWSLPATGTAAVWIGLGVLLGGALTGKLAGLLRAHVGLRRAVRTLQASPVHGEAYAPGLNDGRRAAFDREGWLARPLRVDRLDRSASD